VFQVQGTQVDSGCIHANFMRMREIFLTHPAILGDDHALREFNLVQVVRFSNPNLSQLATFSEIVPNCEFL
jgi:hypothetical protein